jgi:hypothetical protein
MLAVDSTTLTADALGIVNRAPSAEVVFTRGCMHTSLPMTIARGTQVLAIVAHKQPIAWDASDTFCHQR